MSDLHLNPQLYDEMCEHITMRKGFGEGLHAAGTADERVMALCADVTESAQIHAFREAFPERYVEIGVAEQNLATVGSGLAAVGKIPFIATYSAFSPGRNWEQIRTTIALNDLPVKVVGLHAGVSVGPDGATHQMLEDIALMRALPNMVVVVPCDTHEAKRATLAIARTSKPAYLRLAREKTAVVTTVETPFEIGRAYVLTEGHDATIVACGPLVHEALKAARALHKHDISVEVINCPTIKPLDTKTILTSARKTGAVLTVEEGQINGGLGSAVAELLGEQHPVPLARVGVQDRFGQSGKPSELWDEYELSAPHIERRLTELLKRKVV